MNLQLDFLKGVVVAIALLATTTAANADILAYHVPSPSAGVQNFSGSLGMDFDVITPIMITQMGVFDADQNGIVNTTLTSQIWLRSNMTLVAGTTTTFTSGDPGSLVDGSRFKGLGPCVILLPGEYTISAYGYGADELAGNPGPIGSTTNDGGGLISFVGKGRFGAAGAFPGSVETGVSPVNPYAAGTFAFTNAIPEPSTGLVGVLFATILISRRKR